MVRQCSYRPSLATASRALMGSRSTALGPSSMACLSRRPLGRTYPAWRCGCCGTCLSGRSGSSPAGRSTRTTWCASRPSGSGPPRSASSGATTLAASGRWCRGCMRGRGDPSDERQQRRSDVIYNTYIAITLRFSRLASLHPVRTSSPCRKQDRLDSIRFASGPADCNSPDNATQRGSGVRSMARCTL